MAHPCARAGAVARARAAMAVTPPAVRPQRRMRDLFLRVAAGARPPRTPRVRAILAPRARAARTTWASPARTTLARAVLATLASPARSRVLMPLGLVIAISRVLLTGGRPG